MIRDYLYQNHEVYLNFQFLGDKDKQNGPVYLSYMTTVRKLRCCWTNDFIIRYPPWQIVLLSVDTRGKVDSSLIINNIQKPLQNHIKPKNNILLGLGSKWWYWTILSYYQPQEFPGITKSIINNGRTILICNTIPIHSVKFFPPLIMSSIWYIVESLEIRFNFSNNGHWHDSLVIRIYWISWKVWRHQRVKQKPQIKEGQTIQWPIEKEGQTMQ